jgi:chromosomal replication initiation ATPase DnaA
MEDTTKELFLLNKLSENSRQLGQAYYLLELITEEKAIKKTSKERIEKFLLDAKKVKKVKNTSHIELSEMLIRIVFDYYNIPLMVRYIKSRKRQYVKTRHVSMFLLHEHFKGKVTLKEIGELFMKDHTTVLHSVKSIQNFLDIKDPEITNEIESLRQLVNKIYD